MIPDLAVRVAVLETTVARLTAALDAGGPDRRLSLKEVAVRLGRSPATVRRWLADPVMRRRFAVDRFLRRVGGRWSSTPAEVERWARFLTESGAR